MNRALISVAAIVAALYLSVGVLHLTGGFMADQADVAGEEIDREISLAISKIDGEIQPGIPGDCDLCGEWSGRLIGGACAPCRDKYRLP